MSAPARSLSYRLHRRCREQRRALAAEVQFYSDHESFLDGLTQFIGNALKAGSAVIVVATESHRERLLPRLQSHGLDIAGAIGQGRYISLDAAEALSTFIFKGVPDPVRFLKLFGNLIATAEAAKKERGRVVVFGEGVHLLCAQGNAGAAIQVEKLANQLAKTYDVNILCGYSLGSAQGGMDSHISVQSIQQCIPGEDGSLCRSFCTGASSVPCSGPKGTRT